MEEPKTITEPVQSQVQNNEPTTTEPVQAQVQNSEPQTNDNQVNWQEKTNEIVKKEKTKAKASVLKDLGFEDLEQAKSSIEEFRAFKESQKSEEEKKQEEFEALRKQNEELAQRAKTLEMQNKLASLNVPQDRMQDAIAFAQTINGSEDFDTKIKTYFGKEEVTNIQVLPKQEPKEEPQPKQRTMLDLMTSR